MEKESMLEFLSATKILSKTKEAVYDKKSRRYL